MKDPRRPPQEGVSGGLFGLFGRKINTVQLRVTTRTHTHTHTPR